MYADAGSALSFQNQRSAAGSHRSAHRSARASLTELRSEKTGESSAKIRARIEAARTRQHGRFAGTKITSNARMTHAQIRKHCAIQASLGDLLQQAMEQLSLSARAYDRILKVARTIADLAGAERIESPHLLEAIQYRSLDRTVFY
jgi:magnesium chelatase family protein